METQSDALLSSGLQQHGFKYINLDSGWQGSFDGNGRPIPNTTIFPDIKAMVDHIHANGQKVGLYWIPGIEQPAVDGNYPILGTPYHTQDIVVKPLTAGNAFGGAAIRYVPTRHRLSHQVRVRSRSVSTAIRR